MKLTTKLNKTILKSTNQPVLIVDEIDNHYAITTLKGKEIFNKSNDCGMTGDFPKKETDHCNCNYCSDGFFNRNELGKFFTAKEVA